MKRQYWIGVVSKSHVLMGVEGGFMQLNHGKSEPLRRLHAMDNVVFYSPRQSYPDGDLLQAFTAIGVIKSGEVYQADMGGGFKPYRLDVDYLPCKETPIKPLISKLSFIKNKQNWGMTFRFGHLQIPEADFRFIAQRMESKFLEEQLEPITKAGKHFSPVH